MTIGRMRKRSRRLPPLVQVPDGMMMDRNGDLIPEHLWRAVASALMSMRDGVSFRRLDTGNDYDLAERTSLQRAKRAKALRCSEQKGVRLASPCGRTKPPR
jgi:hypothetical protein